MPSLITLAQAKHHLRLPEDSTEFDDDLEVKIDQATAIVIDFLKDPDLANWTTGSPGSPGTADDVKYIVVQAAVAEVLGSLWRFRGDTQDMDGPITKRVKDMLRRFRDPALA